MTLGTPYTLALNLLILLLHPQPSIVLPLNATDFVNVICTVQAVQYVINREHKVFDISQSDARRRYGDSSVLKVNFYLYRTALSAFCAAISYLQFFVL